MKKAPREAVIDATFARRAWADGDPLDDRAPNRAKPKCRDHRQRERPVEGDPESEAQDCAQHHGAALCEVHRVRHGMGDMKSEREEPVHAAEPQAGNER